MNHENINHADLKLFREKFRPLYAAVKGSGFCRRFAAKKYRHSVQVLTIGREIAARDEQLKKEDAAFHALGERRCFFTMSAGLWKFTKCTGTTPLPTMVPGFQNAATTVC